MVTAYGMTTDTVEPPAIVGVSIPEAARYLPDETSMGITLRSVVEALEDAGLDKSEVNGACIAWNGPGQSPGGGSSNWARQLGVTLNWVIDGGLDAVGIRGLLNATAAIRAGLCETVVVAGGLAGGARVAGADFLGSRSDSYAQYEFNHPFGGGVMWRFALNAQRHMHDYGTTPEQLAHVAATIRNHGHANPEATMYGRGPYTVEDVLASRWIAEPLHLLECCLVGQGAAAFVVTTAERARSLRHPPVSVLAGAMEISQGPHHYPSLNSDEGMLGAKRMRTAFGQAGVTPADVDVVSLYDPTAFEVIRWIEALGFCDEGEGGAFVEGNTLARDGRLPANVDGGTLSHMWASTAQLTAKVVEGVRQLRQDQGSRQVAGAEVAVCTNSVPGAHHVEMCILGRAR
ncbi:thiolase family protein [Jatrophihabitans sp. DSM 45814]